MFNPRRNYDLVAVNAFSVMPSKLLPLKSVCQDKNNTFLLLQYPPGRRRLVFSGIFRGIPRFYPQIIAIALYEY